MWKKILKSYDYSLAAVYFLVTIFGLIMVYSASMVTSIQVYGLGDSSYFFDKQLINLLIGSAAFFITALIPYKILKNKTLLMLMVFGILTSLILVLYAGNNVNNATSWFQLGSRALQPSEFAKLAIIIYLSAVYAKKQSYLNDFTKGVAPPVLFLVLTTFLTGIEPDFGTALIIFATGCLLIFCTGMNWKNLLKLALIGLLGIAVLSPLIWVNRDAIFTENRLGRIYSYLDPFAYENDLGHQLVNSYVAIAAGGWKGVGLGKSVQKLGYLPEAHTDFIMAIIAEELGIFGVVFVLFCLGYIVLKGFYIGLKCRDPFGSLLAFGISGLIGFQSFVNLGGVSGLIPITGVPLPFISYGGSSLLCMSIAMGLLMNVSLFANLDAKKSKQKIPASGSLRPVPSRGGAGREM
jgi:cell division-specific peptidoglycan biosynthesis regulator FtsW